MEKRNNENWIKTIKKLFDKMIYVLEFILSLILIKLIWNIATTKIYQGYYDKTQIVILALLTIAIVSIIIYICRKYKEVVQKIFLAFAIPISIAYAIFMLPLNVPDEGSHILKAYDMSIGNILTQMDETNNSYTMQLKELENYSYTRFRSYQDVIEETQKSTNYDEHQKTVCAAQAYSPILYVGTATVLAIARLFHINIIIAIYLARLVNIVIFLSLGYLAIKKIPFGKLILAVVLCMPMMLQQAGSCSADVILNAVLVYYIAHLVYLLFKEEKMTRKDKVLLYILTALMAMFKYIYILVAGILFIGIFYKKQERKDIIKTIIIMILIGSIFSIGWLVFTSRYTSSAPAVLAYNEMANVNSANQIEYIKQNPIAFAKTFIKEYISYGYCYINEAVGSKLGWLEVNISQGIIMLYLLLLVVTSIAEYSKYEFKNKAKLWIIAILFVISAILNMIMYITFTPVGLQRICGVQGRYYTPILCLLLLCLVKKENHYKINSINIKMMTVAMLLNVLTLVTMFINYK